jgi:hypothetical protein
MLPTEPGPAVVGLKRSALGVRFLLTRWQRLLRLLLDEGTLYGADRDEYINYQGSKVTTPEDLFHSEGAYLTYLFQWSAKELKPRRFPITSLQLGQE